MNETGIAPPQKARRQRYGEGYVKRVGTRAKKWLGIWHVYVVVDGCEVRRKRKKVLGPATMSKQEAKTILRKYVASDRPGSLIPALDFTVAELWDRYVTYKSAAWGAAMRETMCSLFRRLVLPVIGTYRVKDVTVDPLQAILTRLAGEGRSRSAIGKVKTHTKALFEYAVDLDLIDRNPARGRRVVIPKKGIKKSSERFYQIDEVHRLLAKASGREHLILRLLLVCGFRPAELFALRVRDVEQGRVMVDEAIKAREKGDDRIGDPKTDGSIGYVAISAELETELRQWIVSLPDRNENAWLFPASKRRGIRIAPMIPANYLKRTLKPLAVAASVDVRPTGKRDKEGNPILTSALTYQAMRRTCATFFRQDLKSAQAQLRHSSPMTTDKHYRKAISADQRAAVERLDAEFSSDNLLNEDEVSPNIKKAC